MERKILSDNLTLCEAFLRLKTERSRGVTFIEGSGTDKFISYADLVENAMATLAQLQERGLRPSDKLIFQLDDNQQFLCYFWACLLGGICPVPVTVGNEPEHKAKVLAIWNRLQKPYIVGTEKGLSSLINYTASTSVGFNDEIHSKLVRCAPVTDSKSPVELHAATPDQLAYLQFSSGSTGDPKGVMLTHHNLVTNVSDIIERSRITEQDSMLSWMPLTHDMGLICFHFSGILSGVNQYLMPASLFIRNPQLWLDKATQYKSTLLYSPNFGYEYLLSSLDKKSTPDWDLSSVRNIYNGAEHISRTLCESFTRELSTFGLNPFAVGPGYGLAEASVAVCLPNVGDPVVSYSINRKALNIGDRVQFLDAQDPRAISFVEVGFPISHCQVRLCNETNEVLGDLHVGMIQIKGDNVTKGYYGDAAATADVITSDGWLNTGDLGFFKGGRLVIVGRRKNIIIINGQNYYPHDIEKICEEGAGINFGRVAACGAVNRTTGREELILFVAHKGSLASFAEIVVQLKQCISKRIGLMPDAIVPVKKILRTTSGKKQHYKLKELYVTGKFDLELTELDNILRSAITDSKSSLDKLTGIVRTFTDLPVRPDSSVLELGLNSLKVVQLRSSIEKAFGYTLSIKDIFDSPTIQQLASVLAKTAFQNFAKPLIWNSSEEIDLTSSQYRLWSVHHAHAGRYAANLAFAFSLKGVLSIELFTGSIRELFAQHEGLHITFGVDQFGAPKQRYIIFQKAPFSFTDISHESDRDQIIDAVLKNERTYSFDLSNEPLIRFSLVKTRKTEYVFSIVMHHLITDGWSINVLLHELFDRYNAMLSGSSFVQSKPGHLHNIFSRVDGESSAKATRNEEYWINELSGDLPIIELDKYRERPALPSFEGKSTTIRLTKRITRRLQEVALTNNATSFMTLMAALSVLFHKITQNTDVLLATEVAGRTDSEWDATIGHFINTVFLRTKIEAQDTFESVLKKVRQKALDAFDHQLYSVDRLMQRRHDRGQATTGLFNVLVTFQNFEGIYDFQDPGAIEVNRLANTTDTCLVDLHIDVVDLKDHLEIEVRYNTDIYRGTAIKRFVKSMQQVLQSVALAPSMPIAELDLITANDRELVLSYSAGPARQRPATLVYELVASSSAKRPHAVAIVCEDCVITYSFMESITDQLAAHLRMEQGIEKGDRIGIHMKRSENIIMAFLGILKSGAIVVPIDIETPTRRFDKIVEESQIKFVVTDSWWGSQSLERIDCKTPAEAVGEDIAYALFTSGTSGTPKGVAVSHNSLLDYVLTFGEYFSVSPDDRVVQQASSAFDTFIEEVFPALVAGAQVIVLREGGRNVDSLIGSINNFGATILSATPLLIKELNERSEEMVKFPIIISGGDVLKSSHISKLIGRTKIYNTYGPTEATVCSLYNPVQSDDQCEILGAPICNRSVYILNESNQLVAPGQPGEIVISGHGVAEGYLNNPGETHDKFVNDIFKGTGKMYRTGDLGRWTKEGKVEFLGRRDSQIKVRGYRVELGEIEKALQGFGDLREAIVVNSPKANEARIIGYYIPRPNFEVETLRKFLRSVLPHYMLPAELVCLGSFPLNTNGTVDRTALLQSSDNNQQAVTVNAPKTWIEKAIASAWGEILGVTEVDLNDNFFEIGGQSIKAMKVLSHLRRNFEIDLELHDMFMFPTIAEQSALIANSSKHAQSGIQSIEDQQHYPVSHSQKRLWVLDQLEQARTAYNIPLLYELTGNVNSHALVAAFEELVRRHEILRTSFIRIGIELRQRVLDKDHLSGVAYVDLRTCEQPLQVARERAREEAVTPFDLSNGPLLRVTLFRIQDQGYLLAVNVHHIVFDGWSAEVLNREISDLYTSFNDNTVPAFNGGKIQYRDFTVWQNRVLKSNNINEHREYWINRFSNGVSALELPSDRSRPANQTFNGASHIHSIDAALTRSLNQFARGEQVTLFMLLLATFKVLLFRLSAQRDITIGTPIAGREHHDLENQVGCYLNLLPLRTVMQGSQAFRSLLNDVKQTTLSAYKHQRYPFDQLIDDIHLQRDMSRAPFFDVMFILQNGGTHQPMLLSGTTMTRHASDLPVSRFDITLTVTEEDSGLQFHTQYNTDLYDSWRIEQMMRHYEQLLRKVLAQPEVTLQEIDYLAVDEKKILISEGSESKLPYETVSRWFESIARENNDRIAVVADDRLLTYDQLNRESNKAARYMLHRGIQPGDVVAIMSDRDEETLIRMIGSMKLGASYLPLNPDHPVERIKHALFESEAKALITPSRLWTKNTIADECMLTLTCEQDDREGFSDSNVTIEPDPRNWMYILFTSGSTGQPKGVAVPNRAVANLLHGMQNTLGFGSSERLLAVSSFTFDISVLELFLPIVSGSCVIISPDQNELDLSTLEYLIDCYDISLMQATPSFWTALTANGWQGKPSLKILCGGEMLSERLASELTSRVLNVWNMYGPTETTIWSMVESLSGTKPRVTIGKPIQNTSITLLDDNNHLVPVGVPGQICIGGLGVSAGYLNQPELTATKFIQHPYLEGERVYCTGDIGRWTSAGTLEFLGRRDSQVKVRGHRMELGEIENAILKCNNVSEAVVICRPDKNQENELICFLNDDIDTRSVREQLKDLLPGYMIPTRYIGLTEFPVNSSGKIDRSSLNASTLSDKVIEHNIPQDETERQLLNAWMEVLDRSDLDTQSNFFEEGGHSLKAIRLSAQLQLLFGVNVSLRDIFIRSTVQAMASWLKATHVKSTSQILPMEEQDHYPVSHGQKRLWIFDQVEKTKAAYNIAVAYSIDGELDQKALEKAFQLVLDRHESLRTVFALLNEEPRQCVKSRAEVNFRMPLTDLSAIVPDDEACHDLMLAESMKTIDLQTGPLVSAMLIKRDHNKYCFLLTMAHIISDGWSMEILTREVLHNYRALTSGSSVDMEALTFQYRDFVRWQNEKLAQANSRKEKEFWTRELAGITPLEIPTDYQRPPVRDFGGDHLTTRIPEDLVSDLHAFSSEKETTIYTVVMAAVNSLLYYYTHQRDLVVGTPIATSRDIHELDDQIGFYLNTLPIRTRIKEGETFLSLLQTTKDTLLKTYAYKEYPFDMMIEDLRMSRTTGRSPVFDVLVTYNRIEYDTRINDQLVVEQMPLILPVSKFDVSFTFVHKKDSIEYSIVFNNQLFSPDRIKLMSARLLALLGSIVSDPGIELDVLSTALDRHLAGSANEIVYELTL